MVNLSATHVNIISKGEEGEKKLHVSWKINNHLPSFYFYHFCFHHVSDISSINNISKQISLFNSILLLFILLIKFSNFWDLWIIQNLDVEREIIRCFFILYIYIYILPLKLQIIEIFVKNVNNLYNCNL